MIELNPFTKTAAVPATPGKLRGPRNILIAMAVLEFLTVLWNFLFGRMSILFRDPLEPAATGIGDFITKAYLACHPFLVLAAVALAATGRIRQAIVAFGAIEIMRWLNYMTSVARNGLRLEDGFAMQWTAAQIFLFPLIAACGIALALSGKRPGLASALISIPILYNLAGFTLFATRLLIDGP
jgi:hypothetical protein